jgi:lactoylglutathione lyase
VTEPTERRWAAAISAVTLFVEDLGAARAFYGTFAGSPIHEDDDSVVFAVGPTHVNVLHVRAAPEVITPLLPAGPDAGPRAMLTIPVGDVDAVVGELAERGVELLNGPVDRPWGVRTAAFRDPAGHVWEVAQPLG